MKQIVICYIICSIYTAFNCFDQNREDVHRLVMKIYAVQGKRQTVKEQFQNLQQLLRKELSIEPEPETRRTFQDLFK